MADFLKAVDTLGLVLINALGIWNPPGPTVGISKREILAIKSRWARAAFTARKPLRQSCATCSIGTIVTPLDTGKITKTPVGVR